MIQREPIVIIGREAEGDSVSWLIPVNPILRLLGYAELAIFFHDDFRLLLAKMKGQTPRGAALKRFLGW